MLIGRGHELARIEQLLAAARLGTSQTLVLAGEPGIGKTALLEHAVERARGHARAAGARGRVRGGDPVRRPARAAAAGVRPARRAAAAAGGGAARARSGWRPASAASAS